MPEELKKIKSGKGELKEFGVTIGTALIILADIAALRGRPIYAYFLSSGVIFAVLGLIYPMALKPLQIPWMAFSIILGFFMNRVIMALLFYFIVTPMNLIARIIGKDILDERIDRTSKSYWSARDGAKKDRKYYENQY